VPADNCLDAWEEQAMMDPEELYAEYQPAGLRHFPSWTADSAEELAPALGIRWRPGSPRPAMPSSYKSPPHCILLLLL
jgi:hypothetical protein